MNFIATTSDPHAEPQRRATATSDVDSSLATLGRSAVRRALDVLLTLGALSIIGPIILVLAIMIRIESPGSPFFSQPRVGRGGRTFRFYKLRSMYVDNDSAEHEAYLAALISGDVVRHDGKAKLVNDPRITRVGAVIRALSLDELPQFVNVLKGDMAIVGPRPGLPNEVARYTTRMHRRLDVLPGITGPWQVAGRANVDFETMIELDLDYVENQSVWRDLTIMFKTPKAMFFDRATA